MDADREAGQPVVREHPLPAREIAERRCGSGRSEPQRELLGCALRPGHRAGDASTRPSSHSSVAAALAERVACAPLDERDEAVPRDRRPSREVANVQVGPVRVPLVDEGNGIVLAPIALCEADTNELAGERAL